MCFLGGGCIAPVGQARNMFSKKTRRGVFLRLQNHSAPDTHYHGAIIVRAGSSIKPQIWSAMNAAYNSNSNVTYLV